MSSITENGVQFQSLFAAVRHDSSLPLTRWNRPAIWRWAHSPPTLQVDNAPYLSTVLQLSLLAWVHRKTSLAQAIVQTMEERMEGAPPDASARALPSQENIAGVIRACEDQTSAFDWDRLLHAVARTLNLDDYTDDQVRLELIEAQEPITPTVFGFLIEMFPIVQSLLEDRLINIEIATGQCVLVVWAYHVLGLTVLVNIDHKEVRFGEGAEQIIIHSRDPEFKESSIALLEAGDVIFRMSSEEGEFEIDGANKIHAKVFGRNILRERCPSEAVIDEIELIITGIATRGSRCLTKVRRIEALDQCEDMKICVDKAQVIKAARFLFDNPHIKTREVKQYEWSYSAGLVEGTAPFPPSLSVEAKTSGGSWPAKDVWKAIYNGNL